MKILALEKEVPGVNDGQFTDGILKAEARKAWEPYQAGVLRELYFTADTHEAVLMLECESADEGRRQLSELRAAQGHDLPPTVDQALRKAGHRPHPVRNPKVRSRSHRYFIIAPSVPSPSPLLARSPCP